jgi:stage V sporulation protein AC
MKQHREMTRGGITPAEYARRVKRVGPPSPLGRDCAWAFCVGGGICLLGEALRQVYLAAGCEAETAGTLTSCSLIALSAIATILGWYQKLAAHAGAGTLVPITGFANGVVSAAIEFKTEGYVPGTGAKMFTIAGPVIVYGTAAAVVYGLAAVALGALPV